MSGTRINTRRAMAIVAMSALLLGVIEVVAPAPASAAQIFVDDFTSGGFTNWTTSTRLTIDNGGGSPAAPSARAQVTAQSAFAYRDLASTFTQVCASTNVNLAAGTNVDLFRLRSTGGGPIIKAYVGSTGTLQLRSDFGATTTNSGVALGTGWHTVELCGSVGSSTTWDLYRDGVRIVNAWAADTGTLPVARIQIGDTAAKTFTVNFDHVVLDGAPGDEGAPADTSPPSIPGRPTGSSTAPNSIQISWAASTDASPPITYRIYRDGGGTAVGSTTNTSFTDTGLAAGSSHTYTVDAVDAGNRASAKSQASAAITVMAGADTSPPTVPGRPTGSSTAPNSIQISWAASTDASPPITYRIYRDGGGTAVGSTTNTSFTDTGLAAGSSHTYTVDAVDAGNRASAKSQASAAITVIANGGQPIPGHTKLAPVDAKANMPRITTGEITDIEYIGNRVFIAGGFTTIQNNTANNTTSYNQPYLAAYNIDTGLVDTAFRPTFGGGGVTEVEASPNGSRLYIVGRFNTVNGVTKRKVAALNPTNGSLITGFTANANSQATAVDATNTTVYIGGNFTTINGVARVGLAAVNGTTGQVVNNFVNDVSGGVGVDGAANIHALVLTHDETKLLVVHTARRIGGESHTGVAWISTQTNQVLPWHSSIWDDNLQFIGGVQRIYAGAIAPNDQYFVVSAGSGGDRPPISDTAIAFPVAGGDGVEPLWISRHFDSIYSVAISEVAVYVGGHFQFSPSPTAPDPWPGLTDVGYGTGQGLAGYGLGDDVVRRDHLGALDPATGKALEWNPGSNSYEGNKAMLVTPRGVFAGGDGNFQGGKNTGRIAFFDFNTVPAPGPNETTITNPIEGRVEEAAVPFTVDGTATATSGVQRVQLEVRERNTGRYLQDNLTTWGASNTINVNLASPNATSTGWSLPLTISGNHPIQLLARTFAVNGSNDATKAVKNMETFGLSDQTPVTNISGPNGSVIPTLTFTVTGTATDDVGVNSITLSVLDEANRYLQDDGTVSATFNTFRVTPDVVGATNATWSYEVTVPFEDEWTVWATAVDTAGQSDLRAAAATWLVSANAVPPTVSVTAPAVMIPPTNAAPLTVAPGGTMTFSGSAADDEQLDTVEIQLRNSTTRENLGADGSWGTDVTQGWYRISPQHINAQSFNWTYTTPFNLRPGTYSFNVRGTDNLTLTTSSTNQGRLTINVQVAGDAPPTVSLTPTGTQPNQQVLHLDLAGSAADDNGVAAVRVTLRDTDSSRYVQPNGTLAAAYSLLNTTLASPGATSTTWSLSINVPTQGTYSVAAFAFDTVDQQSLSTSGATATYPMYPGDQPPAMVDALFNPLEGATFTDGQIVVSGRLEDDQQIAQAQVSIRDSQGRYMSSSGTFTSTTQSWRTAYLNSPGSPGSNFAYTSPTIPAGAYVVFARGVDQHGFTTTPPYQRNVTVTVPPNDPPVAGDFTISCNQNVCSFDGRSSTDENPTTLTYSWNFGNGTGSGPVPTRTYTSPNTYTVTLTVRDEWGVTSAPVSKTVTITEPAGNQPPNPVINTPSCAGRICNISGVGSADPNVGDTFTYLWNFGDGTPTSTSSSASHTYAADGSYTITLTVTDGWGKSASLTRSITLTEPGGNQPPTAAISTPNCTGRVCGFSGIGSSDPNGDAITYLWNFGDATATSTSSTPSHTYAVGGTYTVTLTVTDWWGRSTSITRSVTVT